MKRFLCTIVALGLVGAAPAARASCRWFGTQVECDLGSRHLLIGTQTAADPSHAGALHLQQFHGADALFDDHSVSTSPLRLELQNVGTDPGLCWKFGDETYCH